MVLLMRSFFIFALFGLYASDPVPAVTDTTFTITTPCGITDFSCKTGGQCIPMEQKCDFRKNCADGSDEDHCVQPYCSFEDKNMCGWIVTHNVTDTIEDSLFQWIPIQAKDVDTKVNQVNKPKTDHTINSTEGWYLLADGAAGRYRDITSLVSPEISLTNAQCALDFWLFCGSYTCNLKVHTVKNDRMTEVWDSNISLFPKRLSDRNWVYAKAYLSSLTKFRVEFNAIRPYSDSSLVALDDISFRNCPPPIRVDPDVTTCDGGQYMCKNGFCIPENLMCDYNDDCLDFSDERDFVCLNYVARCNFEPTICSEWHLESDGYAKWTLTTPSKSVYSNIPRTDHTSQTSEGKFLTAMSSYMTQNLNPRLYSDTINGQSRNCKVRFWYNSFYQTKVLVYIRTSYFEDGMKFLGAFGNDITDYWHKAEFQVPSTDSTDYQIVFEASLTRQSGSISLDDISLTPDCHLAEGRDIPGKPTAEPPTDDCAPDRFSCKNGNCYTRLQRCNFIDDCGDNTDEVDCGTSCTFENGLCGWYNAPGTKTPWSIKKANASSLDMVKKDHTYDNEQGHYITPNGFTRQGDIAQLVTQQYVTSGERCKMRFWYFMYAPNKDPGILSVFLRKGGNKHEILYKKTGVTERQEWYSLVVYIDKQEYFSIGIEAQHGGAFFSTIGVDDIEFNECAPNNPPVECTINEWKCKDIPQCIKIWNVCDGAYNCEDKTDESECRTEYGDCNFDSDNWMTECDWLMQNLDVKWSRAKGGRSSQTGPLRNRNPNKEGYFLYMDSSKANTGDRAGVMTPVFKASQGKCHLRFWYCMNGSPSLRTLEVFSDSIKGRTFSVFVKRGPQGKDWIFGHAEVGNDHDYRISFVATRGEDNKTDIAIDDVSFTSGCQEGGEFVVVTGSPLLCRIDEFQCKSGQVKCIPKAWQCDCARDCEDGSDEENCAITCVTKSDTRPTAEVSMSTTEIVIQQRHCPGGYKLCMDGRQCIPGLLLCDGVKDCSDGSDESYGCDKASVCSGGEYFCSDRTYPPCIHKNNVCDGFKDCSDGSDESLCDNCTATFCQNDGNCTVRERLLLCMCKPTFYGNRCNTKMNPPEPDEELKVIHLIRIGWIISIVTGAALFTAIMFLICRRRTTKA